MNNWAQLSLVIRKSESDGDVDVYQTVALSPPRPGEVRWSCMGFQVCLGTYAARHHGETLALAGVRYVGRRLLGGKQTRGGSIGTEWYSTSRPRGWHVDI